MSGIFPSALKVLVVEDDREFAAFIRVGLKDEGLAVTLAFDGGSGPHQAETHAFDIMVLDVMLPRLDGFRGHPKTAIAERPHPHPFTERAGRSCRYREGALTRARMTT